MPIRPEAKPHLIRGVELYRQGRYDEAIEELKAGFGLDPRPEFLYALGQSERKRGNCIKAIDYYQAFLAASPSTRQAGAVLPQIERCQKEIDAQHKEHAKASPSVVPVSPSPATTGTPAVTPGAPLAPRDRTPWYKDWLGGVLVGTGIAAIGVGSVLFFRGNGALDTAPNRYDQFISAAEDGKSQRTTGTVLLVAGGGLVTAGIIRYVLHSRQSTEVAATVPGVGRGMMLAVSGRF